MTPKFLLLLLTAPLWAQEMAPADTTIPLRPRTAQLQQILLCGEQETTMKLVVRLADKCGGWFQDWSANQVELRIPKDSLPSFETQLNKLGRRLDRQFTAQDLTSAFEDQLAGLSSRLHLLETWSQMQNQSRDPRAVLDIQKEIALLAGDIDRRRGALVQLRHQVEYARVVLDFRFQGRTASDRDGQTAFPWLNRLDLPRFQESFR